MHWLKREKWKTGIALAGMLLLLVLMIWVPVSAAGAYEAASGLATQVTGTVQATPTEDATVTALNKEKLAQEVQQLKTQNAPDLFGWLRTNAVLLSTLVVVIGALIGLFRWLGDRRDEQEKRREDQLSEQEKRAEEQERWLEDRRAERERRDQEQQRWLEDRRAEREKRAEERFQAVVEGLGSEREEAKVGAAITLSTFLHPDYKQFYTQVFDLAVAHLRLSRTSHPSEDPDGTSHSPEDPNTPLPLTTLRQALIAVFKEAFPLARDSNSSGKEGAAQSVDVPAVRLDNAYLVGADLERVYMRKGDLRKVNLRDAKLGQAYLQWADFSGAHLRRVDLRGAKLMGTDFRGSSPWDADLRGADCHEADFRWADLELTDLRGAGLWQAKFREANLRRAKLSGADLHQADFSEADLSETDLEEALSLKDTNLCGVKGLTKKQLATCKAKGAIIDEDITTSPPQSAVSPPSLSQSNDGQAQSAPPVQESMRTSDTEGSGATSSQPNP
jgi:uncharacterized protein YjbI with pentapeptide repeats